MVDAEEVVDFLGTACTVRDIVVQLDAGILRVGGLALSCTGSIPVAIAVDNDFVEIIFISHALLEHISLV